jgi:hypothetical protein
MTIYARPEMFIDTTPTFAQNIAGSLGTLAGKGLTNYLQNKQLRELQQAKQENARAQQDFLAQKLEERGIPGEVAYYPKEIQELYLKELFNQQNINQIEQDFSPVSEPTYEPPPTPTPANNQKTLPGLPGLILNNEFANTAPVTAPPPQTAPPPSTPDPQQSRRYTPKQLERLALRDPARAKELRQQYEAEDRLALDKRKADQKDRDYELNTNKNYTEKISSKRDNLSRKQSAITLLGEANTSGGLGFNIRNFLAEKYGMEYVLDPNVPLYNAATKALLIGDRGNIGRSNQFLDKIMKDALGSYRDSQKARYIFQAGLQGTANKEREEIRLYDQLSKEDREKYGYVRADIEDRVNERLGNFYDEEDARTVEKINEIKRGYGFYYSRDFSNPDAYLNAPRGTPLTQEAMDYYLERNNNNWLRAERESYENGYRGATRRGRSK